MSVGVGWVGGSDLADQSSRCRPASNAAMAKRVRKELEQALADSDITGIQIRPVDASHMHFEASIQGA